MERKFARILLVEGDLEVVSSLRAIAEESPLTVRLAQAEGIAEAQAALAQGDADAILLGLYQPEDSALAALESLVSLVPDLPILVIADRSDESLAMKALQRGAQDYLVREQLDGALFARAVDYAIERKQAHNDLRHREESPRTLFNAIPDLILQIRKSGTDLTFKVLKDFPAPLPSGDRIASNFLTGAPGEIARSSRKHIERALSTGEVQVFEYEQSHGDEVRYYETRLVMNAADEVLAIVRDVTVRKLAEVSLQRYAERLRILRNIDQAILAAQSPEAIAKATLRHIQRLVPCQQGRIAVFDLDSRQVTVFATHADNRLPRGTGTLISFEAFGGIEVLQQGQVQVVDDLQAVVSPPSPEVQILQAEGVRSYIRAPLISKEELIGALSLESYEAGVFQQEHMDIAREIADPLAIAIRQARLFNQIQRLAITDELTGLFNRRHFFSLARREFERLRRYGGELSAMMMDVDNFKLINDRFGHATGDRVLHQVAQRLHQNVRETDILARYGGDEFVILLPETNFVSAHQLAERLRHWMANHPVDTPQGPLAISISLGVASVDPQVPDIATLIDLADEDMYAAKQTG